VTDVLSEAAAAAWLEVLGALTSNVAHRANNVFNAAAVNLHVLVSRLAPANIPSGMSGGDLSARTVVYAEQASKALESMSELVQSLLALARPLPTPVDPARMLMDIVRVVVAGAGDGVLDLDIEVQDPVLPREAAPVARLAIAVGMREIQRTGSRGRVSWVGRDVRLSREADGASVHDGRLPMVSDEIVRILDEAGFAVQAQTDVVTFSIPV
jgi:signal transduction histidine kinase